MDGVQTGRGGNARFVGHCLRGSTHGESSVRTSQVAYIVVRLNVEGREYYLVNLHKKWGDWSLVGDHVEPDEAGDWFAAAKREPEEEPAPLRFGTDFILEPIPGGPSQWGPIAARPAGGAPTIHEAAWFSLRFLKNAAARLARLTPEAFCLVGKETALGNPGSLPVSSLLQRLQEALPDGLAAVPMAWSAPIPEGAIRFGPERS